MLLLYCTKSEEVYTAIGNNQLDFTIDNNHYLQGALGTIIAALGVTNGKSLAPSEADRSGAYLPGPTLIIKENLPTDSNKICEAEAFPVCTDNDEVRMNPLLHFLLQYCFFARLPSYLFIRLFLSTFCSLHLNATAPTAHNLRLAVSLTALYVRCNILYGAQSL